MFGAGRYNWSCEIYTCENNLVMNNQSVNCVGYVCTVNKLGFKMNNYDLVYIYVIYVRSVYMYL